MARSQARSKARNVTRKKRRNTENAANKHYKDTIFRWLFSDKENLLSLYNAIAGTDYKKPEDLIIVTLDNAVYMGMKNDLAFILGTGLYLYEHQSTYNPNMPLRDLFYIASEYQKMVDEKSLYSSAIQKIPTPRFLVFYNGTDRVVQDREVLRLSAAYENQTSDPDLELKVTMLNINAGHNKELLGNCRILGEYAQYVERVRKYAADMNLNDAVEKAIQECIREGILADFLQSNRAEVTKVSIFEYDKEWEEKKLRKAEFEYGKEEGLREGLERGLERGLEQGLEQGLERQAQKSVVCILRKKGSLSEEQMTFIQKQKDVDQLEQWLDMALDADSVDAFFESLKTVTK